MKINATLSIAALAAAALLPQAAQALTLPINATVSNSVQAFTADNLAALDVVAMTVSARGNTYVAKPGTPGETNGTVTPAAFGFPITKIVIGGGLSIDSGSAVGSALYFSRKDDDTGEELGLTLANFTIDYKKKQVLADITPKGGTTAVQAPIYDFKTVQDKALKYGFPLSITLKEVLGDLRLTGVVEADEVTVRGGLKEALYKAMRLPEFAIFALKMDYGTLSQDVSLKLRSRAVSTRPYVAN